MELDKHRTPHACDFTLRGRVVLEARGPRGRLHRAEAEREEHGGDDEVDDHRDPREQREAHEAELGGVRVAGRREHRDHGLGWGVGMVGPTSANISLPSAGISS